jgi:RNA polymerase sigma factor (sigma-70 family)
VADAQLLERFVHQNDEAAFELLLWRHGPLVWNLCRRILADFHEAEDAFQATMLVLARRASGINKRLSLASWLYKVAFRIAIRARADSARRSRLEKQRMMLAARVLEPDSANDSLDLRPVIDEGLMQMPEKYRVPILLCYLQNKTNEEAARLLRWPVGTVKTRLAKARELLGHWLRRRGVILSSAGIVSFFGTPTSQAAIPAGVLSATLRAAMLVSAGSFGAAAISVRSFVLMEGALRAMFWTKVKIATGVIVFAGLTGSGVGLSSFRSWGAGENEKSSSSSLVSQHGTTTVSPKKVQPAVGDPELQAAQNDLDFAQWEKKMAETLFELTDSRLDKAKKRVEDIKLKRKLPAQPPADPKDPVAFIFDMPITRQQLGDYLIAQYGADKLEQLVNKLIIERACRGKRITISDEEIEAALKEEMKAMACSSLNDLETTISQRFKGSLSEWKEDIIKPRLCLTKLARMHVSAGEDDVRQAYEGAYGEKVECQIILWPKGQEEDARTMFALFGNRPDELERLAKQQVNRALAVRAGKIDPFGRHTTSDDALENTAFRLKPGETSIVETKSGTMIVKCIRRIPAEDVKLEDVRAKLTEQVLNKKIEQQIPKLFEELRKQAQPRLLLKK